MARTLALRSDRFRIGKLDFTRISAETGAFAIHGAALLLLLAPLSTYVPPVAERDVPPIIIPIAPPKPPEMPVVPTKTEIPRTHVVPVTPSIVPQKIEVQPPLVDPLPGDTLVDGDQIAKVDPGLGAAITTQPLVGAHLEYEDAPPPRYPVEAIRESLAGTVTLRVLVDVDGRPIDVRIERSSGYRILDAAARKQVLAKWRFRPAMQAGRAVQAIGLIPVEFNLNR